MDSASRLDELTDVAYFAYRRARSEIYDLLPVGSDVDDLVLTSDQRDVLWNLMRAEANLADFRYNRCRSFA